MSDTEALQILKGLQRGSIDIAVIEALTVAIQNLEEKSKKEESDHE